ALQRKAGKGTRSTRRRCRQLLQRLSGRERRFQTWVNHRISKSIVARAQATHRFIALEDLTGIRERVNQQPRSKTERRRLNSEAYGPLARGAFYPLRQFVHYKAARAGIQVVVVPPAYSSQTCHRCLWLGQREGKHFRCVNPVCGWEGDADLNGANVIALLGVAVNRPRGPWLACQLQGYRSRQRRGALKPAPYR
ncbi:zinc ribbon domain-containing protein, partial [Synechococcus sp. H55.6]|uniref:zinc ribbon domain-containing protein n=1 Tax=Synechococcus sp. H55.6 TaxID=2964508 RepID=UPI0039C4B6C2